MYLLSGLGTRYPVPGARYRVSGTLYQAHSNNQEKVKHMVGCEEWLPDNRKSLSFGVRIVFLLSVMGVRAQREVAKAGGDMFRLAWKAIEPTD